jgi:8-oxo-dGTP pyrophosphatase MutT (NUDIX family)
MTAGAFAIIQDVDGRFLLSHRPDLEIWNLPGGTVEPGEAPWNAVVREVLEETGLHVVVRRLVGVYTKPRTDTMVFSFHCTVVGGRLAVSDEADEHGYFALHDVPVNHSPAQIERLRDFAGSEQPVVLKIQTLPSSREHLATLGRSPTSGVRSGAPSTGQALAWIPTAMDRANT